MLPPQPELLPLANANMLRPADVSRSFMLNSQLMLYPLCWLRGRHTKQIFSGTVETLYKGHSLERPLLFKGWYYPFTSPLFSPYVLFYKGHRSVLATLASLQG